MLKTKSYIFNLVYSLFTLLAYNSIFLKKVYEITASGLFTCGAAICAFLLLNAACLLLFHPKTVKPLSISLLMLNTLTFYFMYTYNTEVDKIMLLNVLKTDVYEVHDLLSLKLTAFIIVLGLIPSFLIYKTQIIFSSYKIRGISLLLSVLIIAGIILGGYSAAKPFLKNHKSIKYSLIPVNYIGAIISVAKVKLKRKPPLIKISDDAVLKPYWNNGKKNLIVFVMGETARAANFSLNGYHRPTNRPLEKHGKELIYFHDFTACGTSTAVSLPCVFSNSNRKSFKTGSEEYTENVLDILNHAGYKVLWRENNTGCYNVCDRIEVEVPCREKHCLDEVMLQSFEEKVQKHNKNTFVVLHQRGSHGPAYHEHYPESSELYTPVCTTQSLGECSQESLINVYDNSIHYTSAFLSMIIEKLQNLSKEYNTVLIYASDHGESLGEDGRFLHAAPYDTAPAYQKDIPFFVWMPNDTAQALNIDTNCLKNKIRNPYSHDNIYHSVLGLSGIETSTYDAEADIFSSCQKRANN